MVHCFIYLFVLNSSLFWPFLYFGHDAVKGVILKFIVLQIVNSLLVAIMIAKINLS